MRTHRLFPMLQPWAWRSDLVRELMHAEHLAAMRIEPVTRGREPAVIVDLHFRAGERALTVPLVYVDLAQLDARESDPLLFPAAIAGVVPDAQAGAVVERVLEDLERRAFHGGFRNEETVHYGDAALFETARARGFFGAAPLSRTLPRLAAAVYGRRFAFDKTVATYGPEAIELAAFVGDIASHSAALGGNAEARAWYGDFATADAGAAFDLAIGAGDVPVSARTVIRSDASGGGTVVAVAAPLPADLMLSFDDADGRSAASFYVTLAREPFVRPVSALAAGPVAGGSAGRIAVVVRPDGTAVPDSDTAEAATLAEALRLEGFTVEMIGGVDALEAFAPELIHLFGVRPGGFARQVADWASDRRTPLVVQALHESPAAGGYWGAMAAPYCFGYSPDDRSVSLYLEMMARRAVEVDGVGAGASYAPPIAGLADSERVLARADLVFVNSAAEATFVEGFRPRRPTFVVPPLPVVSGPGKAIGALVGSEPFILVHAPIWPEANQLMLARAAGDVGVPVVFAGAVADPIYAERLREFLPAKAVLIAEPAADAVGTLYAMAAVCADAAWTPRGHGRLLTAAAFGAAVVHSSTRWMDVPEGACWTVDPADRASVARGLGEAWEASVRSDPRIVSATAFARSRLLTGVAAIIAGYAKIAAQV